MANEERSQGELTRALGVPDAIWLGLGSIVGTGVFVSIGLASGIAGQGTLLAVALAALVATANGLSSAQLAAAHPVSGGTYEYGYRFLHPMLGFTAGTLFLAAKSASAASAALGFAGYLLGVLGLSASPLISIGIALALVVTITSLVAGGVSRSSRINTLIVATTLSVLGLFVLAGASHVGLSRLVAPLAPDALQEALSSPEELMAATALLFVAYTGYGRIATLGEEVRDPTRTIPRAIIATLLASMTLYLCVAAVLVALGPADRSAPLEAAARALPWPWVGPLVALGAVSAMAGVLLNLVLGLSRVLLAMARRRDAPGALAHVGADASPRRAVWTMGGIIAALVCVGDVRATWSFSAFTVLIYYGLTNLAALRLPPDARRFPRVIAGLGLASCVALAFFVDREVWMVGLVGIALALGARAMVRGRDLTSSA